MGLSSIDLNHPLLISQFAWTLGIPVLAWLLVLLKRRYPHLDTRSWMLALFFLFCTEFRFVAPGYMLPHHTIDIVGQLLAGIALASYKHDRDAQGPDLVFLSLNALPLVLFEGFYGWYVLVPWIYLALCAVGLVTIGVTTYRRRHGVGFAVCVAAGWMGLAVLVHDGAFRWAAYAALAGVYGYAAWNFSRRLPAGSVGKTAIVGCMLVWVFSYVTHPWVFYHPAFHQASGTIWEMQKPLAAIAMLIVLLEDQVAGSRWLAMHDPMTKMPNRRRLEEWLAMQVGFAAEGRGGLALLRVDVHGMQEINDALGYQARDKVLASVAERLVKTASKPAEMVARLDGNEFCVASLNVWDDDALERLEERMRECVRRPIQVFSRTVQVTASFGAAMYPFDAVGVGREEAGAALLEVASRRLNERRGQPVRVGMQGEVDPQLVS